MAFFFNNSSRLEQPPQDRFDNLGIPPDSGANLRDVGRGVVGWLTGYLISAVSSILFFLIGHISPAKPASTVVLWITAIYGIAFAVLGAIVGANFCRRFALGIGAAIALTIGVAAMGSWYLQPDHSHWTQTIAIFLMAPAAQFGALFRREDY
jgi:uncharacterized membrane protein YagU involved in acid resistance